ncbi:hypothetical protein MTR67_052680 [Solanum verrucosum]|uniref:Uncharacterized protein n=1 Tax=Solanum verrucosum TaxID=315347 RepID=A0AAF0V7C0_SOLVR|nr:hypothetical protein MTR67_052680 [Solanum verrucosum]
MHVRLPLGNQLSTRGLFQPQLICCSSAKIEYDMASFLIGNSGIIFLKMQCVLMS